MDAILGWIVGFSSASCVAVAYYVRSCLRAVGRAEDEQRRIWIELVAQRGVLDEMRLEIEERLKNG